MTQKEAEDRGLCSVRVDLDQDDARSQMAFFQKLFDSVFTAACENGAYGRITGQTYQTYQDIVYSFEIPQDKTFCPLPIPTSVCTCP